MPENGGNPMVNPPDCAPASVYEAAIPYGELHFWVERERGRGRERGRVRESVRGRERER